MHNYNIMKVASRIRNAARSIMRLNTEIKAWDDKEAAAIKALEILPRSSNGRRMTHIKDVVKKFNARLNRMCETGGETVKNFRPEIAFACKEAITEAALITRCEASVRRLGFDARDDNLVERYLRTPRNNYVKYEDLRHDLGHAYRIMDEALRDACRLANEHTASRERCASALNPLGFERDDNLRNSLARDFPLVVDSPSSNHFGNTIPVVDVYEDDDLFVNKEMNVAVILRRDMFNGTYRIHLTCTAGIYHTAETGACYIVNNDLRYILHDNSMYSRKDHTEYLRAGAIIEALGSSNTSEISLRELTDRLDRIRLVTTAERELMLHAPGVSFTNRSARDWKPEVIKAVAEGAPIYMALLEPARGATNASMKGFSEASIDICIEGVDLHENYSRFARPIETTLLHVVIP